jgi:hypothetical protein
MRVIVDPSMRSTLYMPSLTSTSPIRRGSVSRAWRFAAGGLALDERLQDPAVQATVRRWASLQAIARRALTQQVLGEHAAVVLPRVQSQRV